VREVGLIVIVGESDAGVVMVPLTSAVE